MWHAQPRSIPTLDGRNREFDRRLVVSTGVCDSMRGRGGQLSSFIHLPCILTRTRAVPVVISVDGSVLNSPPYSCSNSCVVVVPLALTALAPHLSLTERKPPLLVFF